MMSHWHKSTHTEQPPCWDLSLWGFLSLTPDSFSLLHFSCLDKELAEEGFLSAPSRLSPENLKSQHPARCRNTKIPQQPLGISRKTFWTATRALGVGGRLCGGSESLPDPISMGIPSSTMLLVCAPGRPCRRCSRACSKLCCLSCFLFLNLQTFTGTKSSFNSAEHPKSLWFEDRTPLGAPAWISGQTRLQSLWNNLERSEGSVGLTGEIKSPLLIVYLSLSKTFTLDPFQSLSFLKQNCSKA